MAMAHLTTGHFLGVLVQLVDVCAEGLEVRDYELLAECLSQQHDVTLHTPGTTERVVTMMHHRTEPLTRQC